MHIYNVTQAAVLTASAVLTPSPSFVTSVSAQSSCCSPLPSAKGCPGGSCGESWGPYHEPSGTPKPESFDERPPVERRDEAVLVVPTPGNHTLRIVVPASDNSTDPELIFEADEKHFSIIVPEAKIGISFGWGHIFNFTIGNSSVPSSPIFFTQLFRHDAGAPHAPRCVPPIPHQPNRPYPPSKSQGQVPCPPYPRGGKHSPEVSKLLSLSTRPFNSSLQQGYGWVPVPNVNLTSGPESLLNYTDKFNNSAGATPSRSRWIPIPLKFANSSTHGGVPGLTTRLSQGIPPTPGPLNWTGRVDKDGKFISSRRSIHCDPAKHHLLEGNDTKSVDNPLHDILPITDEMQEMLDIVSGVRNHTINKNSTEVKEILKIMNGGGNHATHGNSTGHLGPRSMGSRRSIPWDPTMHPNYNGTKSVDTPVRDNSTGHLGQRSTGSRRSIPWDPTMHPKYNGTKSADTPVRDIPPKVKEILDMLKGGGNHTTHGNSTGHLGPRSYVPHAVDESVDSFVETVATIFKIVKEVGRHHVAHAN